MARRAFVNPVTGAPCRPPRQQLQDKIEGSWQHVRERAEGCDRLGGIGEDGRRLGGEIGIRQPASKASGGEVALSFGVFILS